MTRSSPLNFFLRSAQSLVLVASALSSSILPADAATPYSTTIVNATGPVTDDGKRYLFYQSNGELALGACAGGALVGATAAFLPAAPLNASGVAAPMGMAGIGFGAGMGCVVGVAAAFASSAGAWVWRQADDHSRQTKMAPPIPASRWPFLTREK